MKKLLSILSILAVTVSARAEMDSINFSNSSVGTAQCSRAYVLRGTIKSVYFDVPATKTGAVTVATSEGTVFTVSGITSDTKYNPLQAVHSGTGAAIYEGTNAIYGAIAAAGTVTVTFVPAANTTETNTWSARIILDK